MIMTVDEILDYLGSITHILVRRRLPGDYEILGGGYADSIHKRFGGLIVESVEVLENKFIIYVQ